MYRISVFVVCASVCLLATSSVSFGQSSVVLPVTQDTWIHGTSGTSNEGTNTSLGICPLAHYRIYLKFDLSSVQGDIVGAKLRMTRFSGDRPQELSFYKITDDSWTEATLIGPTRPAPIDPATGTALGVGSASGSFDVWQSSKFLDVVRQEAAGDGTLSLMVREDPDPVVDVRFYYSREGAPTSTEVPQLVVTTAAPESLDPDWSVSDVAIGIKPFFDIGPDGTYHVGGMVEDFAGYVWYASATTIYGPWQPKTVDNGYYYGPGEMRVASDGTVHMAWHNHIAQDPEHAEIDPDGQITLRTLNMFSSHDGWDSSLAFDSGGNLFQATVDPNTFGATESLEFWSFDGNNWTGEKATGSGPFMYGMKTSIAIDSQGDPHVVFCHGSSWTDPGDLYYAVKSGGNWTITAVTSGGIHRFPSLALDQWDRPHVAWLEVEAATPTEGDVRYAVYNGGAWDFETVDRLTHMTLGHTGIRAPVSLVLDRDDHPHLAYGDMRMIRYAQRPVATWQYTTVLETQADRYNGMVVLRLDAQERPLVAFWEPNVTAPGTVRIATSNSATQTGVAGWRGYR